MMKSKLHFFIIIIIIISGIVSQYHVYEINHRVWCFFAVAFLKA